MHSKRKKLIIFGILAATVLVALSVLRLQAPELQPYTSTPAFINGKPYSLQALIPAGWEEDEIHEMHDQSVNITLRPPDQPPQPKRWSWAPEWLKRVFGIYDKDDVAELVLTLGERSPYYRGYPSGLSQATREIESRPFAAITYVRSNGGAFDATERRICESLRVTQEK